MRPIHFSVLFWGEHYRQHYFLDWFLPSMMSPNNLPLLKAEDGHKFFIATTEEDWEWLQRRKIFFDMRKYVHPVHVPIDAPTGPDDDKRSLAVRHQNQAFVTLLRAAYDPNAYGSTYCPDFIMSDGIVKLMLEHIDKGTELVLMPALRQIEEPILNLLKMDLGVWADANGGMALRPDLVARLSAKYLHREMEPYTEPLDKAMTHAPFRIWKMPGGGIMLHTFFAHPILMDYRMVTAVYPDHNNTDIMLRTENYLKCDPAKIHIVTDSDEACLVSLTPAAGKHLPTYEPQGLAGYLSTLIRMAVARKFFLTDHIRKKVWETPIFIGGNRNKASVGFDTSMLVGGPISLLAMNSRTNVAGEYIKRVERMIWLSRFIPVVNIPPRLRKPWEVLKRLAKACCGDSKAVDWVATQVQKKIHVGN